MVAYKIDVIPGDRSGPEVVNGEIVARKVTELTLSFDHRVTDGGIASAFLTAVADAMHHPASALADL